MNVERELEKFLRQQLFRERTDGPIAKLELRHASPGAKGNVVDDFEVATINVENVSMLVDEVMSRSQNDANGIGGVQRYELLVILSDAGKKAGGRFAFRVRGEDDSMEEGVAGDEAPNMKGLLTQLMRHNETQNRTMMQSVGAMVRLMSDRMGQDQDTIKELLDERKESWKLLEAAKSEDHEREMMLLEEMKKQERTDLIVGKLNALFPVIINKLVGKSVLSVEEKSVLSGFVDSLSQEQFQAITQSLRPEQQIALFSAIKSIKDGEQKTLPQSSS